MDESNALYGDSEAKTMKFLIYGVGSLLLILELFTLGSAIAKGVQYAKASHIVIGIVGAIAFGLLALLTKWFRDGTSDLEGQKFKGLLILSVVLVISVNVAGIMYVWEAPPPPPPSSSCYSGSGWYQYSSTHCIEIYGGEQCIGPNRLPGFCIQPSSAYYLRCVNCTYTPPPPPRPPFLQQET
eukprot:TRINITY_DN1816_c0_g1_i1.p1 TRINITY_DN1816_c0_g1~~TRINITY_DN1816_c0_g1_i1.p1  ORF type:complete len:193 (+),score=32.57 TRINITY_DN1816_c0_g1_i1:31-579(+)